MSVLLTGGTGYIGSHTAVELINRGIDVILVDNLTNSYLDVIDDIQALTGVKPKHYIANISNIKETRGIFEENNIDAVIHFAALKKVNESVNNPISYYRNNLDSTIVILELMQEYGIEKLVFSSSAAVYGQANKSPVVEDADIWNCENAYGMSKCMCEQIIKDAANARPNLSAVIFRYFNPIGAHHSGMLGEHNYSDGGSVMSHILDVAFGNKEMLSIYGDDYPTHDGTGVRDYIHVEDVARGHVAALDLLDKRVESEGNQSVFEVINLGTGHGYSVLDLVNTFERVNGVEIPYKIEGRRAGDVAECFANADKANNLLQWKAKRNLEEMCRDSWKWHKRLIARHTTK